MSNFDKVTDTSVAVSDFSMKSWWALQLPPSVKVTSSL